MSSLPALRNKFDELECLLSDARQADNQALADHLQTALYSAIFQLDQDAHLINRLYSIRSKKALLERRLPKVTDEQFEEYCWLVELEAILVDIV